MKNILVTGGLGILGISLVKLLAKEKEREIIVLDKCKYNFLKKELPKHVKIIKSNFNNIKIIKDLIEKNNINCIFHLGAITQINDSYKNPYNTLKTNLFSTIKILEFLRNTNKQISLIYASSDKAYGEMTLNKYSEDHKLQGIFPYDVSKSTSDLICQSYSKSYGLKIGIIRSGNIYGPCDLNFQRLIPDLIIKGLKKKKFLFRSNGKVKRDYIYVDDVAKGYIKLMIKMGLSKQKLFIYNIGSKNNFSALKVLEKISSKLKIGKNFSIENNSKIEIKNQNLNFNKIKKDLNWNEKISFDNGLNKTIQWYINNLKYLKF
jgi:CDP-glucose 4,6-dehydratase